MRRGKENAAHVHAAWECGAGAQPIFLTSLPPLVNVSFGLVVKRIARRSTVPTCRPATQRSWRETGGETDRETSGETGGEGGGEGRMRR